jgi:acyl-CoA synthetase (AMP-forming)/AMP-acid ligase II
VLACRRLRERENVRGTVGLPMPGTQVRVVDADTRADLPDGQQARRRTLVASALCTATGVQLVRDQPIRQPLWL